MEALLVLHEPLHQPLEEGRRRAQLLLLHLVPPPLPLLAPRLPHRRLLLRLRGLLRLHHRRRVLPCRRLRHVRLRRLPGRGSRAWELRHGRRWEHRIVVTREA